VGLHGNELSVLSFSGKVPFVAGVLLVGLLPGFLYFCELAAGELPFDSLVSD